MSAETVELLAAARALIAQGPTGLRRRLHCDFCSAYIYTGGPHAANCPWDRLRRALVRAGR